MQNRSSARLLGVCLRAAIGLSCIAWWACPISTARGDNDVSGSSSRQFRNDALQLVPYQLLNQVTRDKISDILQKPSLYRRLPVNSIVADPDYFRFLTRYPEVIVNIWQIMGVTQMKTKRTGPFTLETDDGAGTLSTLELIYGNENLHIFYGTGTYEGPVIHKKLTGRCVLILRSDYATDAQGQSQVTNQMDVFLKVDNATLGLVAKTIQPIVGPTADQNFIESLKFVQRLNETTATNGPGVQQMGTRLNIDDDVRQKFIEVAGLTYERASNGIASGNASPALTAPTALPQPMSYRPASSPNSKPSGLGPNNSPGSPEAYRPKFSLPPVQTRPPKPIQTNQSSTVPIQRIEDERYSVRSVGYEVPLFQLPKRF